MVRHDLDLLVRLDIPLDDVSVIVSGDQLFVERAPNGCGDLGARRRDGNGHDGLV